jgi:hypothetical protein
MIAFDPPRWRGGPKLCSFANLPAFSTIAEGLAFHTVPLLRWHCRECGCWHFWCGYANRPKYQPPDRILRLCGLLWTIPDSESDPIGKARRKIHEANGTRRLFEDGTTEDRLGAKAELAFSKMTGIPMDKSLYLHGDGCKDFVFDLNGRKISVDVKGARNAKWLLGKVGFEDRYASVFVQAEVTDCEVLFLGWERRKTLIDAPLRETKPGFTNHWIEVDRLQPMLSLLEMINSGRQESAVDSG